MTVATRPNPDRELIDATRRFAVESLGRSWWVCLSTKGMIALAIAAATVVDWWPARLALSVVAGLLLVRGFVIYHDFMHGSILRRSRLARGIMYVYGLLVLTPPRVWRHTHNYHHAHTCKIVGSHVGSYPIVTTEMWRDMSVKQRLLYRATRHPANVLFGYLTVFLYGMCIAPFLRRPKKHWDSALALVVHVALVASIGWFAGADVLFFAYLFPLMVACAAGAYLFYAQHNFDGVHIQARDGWNYCRAALESSSYMDLGLVLHWFTGNIGYHHVHHLNPRIPFYRLPEAMAAIPALQQPSVTTLSPGAVSECFRAKLWDAEAGCMTGYPR